VSRSGRAVRCLWHSGRACRPRCCGHGRSYCWRRCACRNCCRGRGRDGHCSLQPRWGRQPCSCWGCERQRRRQGSSGCRLWTHSGRHCCDLWQRQSYGRGRPKGSATPAMLGPKRKEGNAASSLLLHEPKAVALGPGVKPLDSLDDPSPATLVGACRSQLAASHHPWGRPAVQLMTRPRLGSRVWPLPATQSQPAMRWRMLTALAQKRQSLLCEVLVCRECPAHALQTRPPVTTSAGPVALVAGPSAMKPPRVQQWYTVCRPGYGAPTGLAAARCHAEAMVASC